MKPLIKVDGWIVRDSGGGVQFIPGEKPYRTFHTNRSERDGRTTESGTWRSDSWSYLYFSELGISQEGINKLLPDLDWSSEPQPFTLELWKKEE